jgi:hypothetical protein
VNPRALFRLTAPTLLAWAGVIAGSIACALVLAFGTGGSAVAQETDLPGVSADSLHSDFMRKPPVPPAAPGVTVIPSVPTPPVPPYGSGDRETQVIRRRIHAGDNDVVQVGQDIVVERGEHVMGKVFAMGGNITVRGIVDDDVVAMGGDVTLEDGAQVRGDVVSLGGVVHKAPGATVGGDAVTVGGLPKRVFDFRTLAFLGQGVAVVAAVVKVLFWLFVGWIVILISSVRSRRVLDRIERAPAASIGWGFLGLLSLIPATVAIALVAVLLVVTIIGIPVAAMLLLGYLVAVVALLLWGGVLGATALGAWIVRRLSPQLGEATLMRSMLVGVLAMGVLNFIGPMFRAMGMAIPPAALFGVLLTVVGKSIQCLALLAGLGGVLHARAGQVDPVRMPWATRLGPVGPTGPPVPPPPAPAPPQ